MAWQNSEDPNFLLDGKQVKRDVVLDRICEILEEHGVQSCAEIVEKIGMEHKSVHYCLRYMTTLGMVLTKKVARWTHYFLPVNCALDNLFHPEFKEIRSIARHSKGKIYSSDDNHTKAPNPNKPQSHTEHTW